MQTRAITICILALSIIGYGEESFGVTDAMRKPCVNCHTMHNSQNNAPVVGGGSLLGNKISQRGLLNNTCYGCHTGTNTGVSIIGKTPFVFDNSAANYGVTGTEGPSPRNTLAGGNFYWPSIGSGFSERTGHNVEVITAQFSRSPQGSFGDFLFDGTSPLTCAGTRGCHGLTTIDEPIDSLMGAHHSVGVTIDGGTVGTSYRYLKGIVGIEKDDWEYNVSSTEHNQYSGVDRTDDQIPVPASTISSLCARCHGDFHNDARTGNPVTFGVNSWLRHPVDYDMNNVTGGTEYDGYGGVGSAYVVQTPVATANLAGGVRSTVSVAGDAIITCISCHRAHGTPFDNIMRWDYKNWPASGYNGCGDCHTFRN